MATTTIRFEINASAMNNLLKGDSGAVRADLRARGTRVVNGAKQRCPVDSGRLRASITQESGSIGGQPVEYVGTNVEYARFIHDGTGIYGPRGVPIVPKRARFLVFTPRGSSTTVFAKQVRGVKPTPFLAEALQDAR
jgi:hypothetical protein